MSDGQAQTAKARIQNQKGLHARAAAKFVKVANGYDAEIRVIKGETDVSGRSIMGLMMLAAGPGTSIHIEADGPQAREAVNALATLVEAKFDED